MKCRHIREFFSIYLDNEANDTVNDAVEAHIAVCEKCRQELEQLKKIINSLQEMESVQPPPDFSRMVMNRLHEEHNGIWSHSQMRGRKRTGGFITAVAGIALLMGIGTSSYFDDISEKVAVAWAKKNLEKKTTTTIAVDDIINRLYLGRNKQRKKEDAPTPEETDNAKNNPVIVADRTVPHENEPADSDVSEMADPSIPPEADENPPTPSELEGENPIEMALLEAGEKSDATTEQATDKNRLVFAREIMVKDIPAAVVGAEKIALDLGAPCTYLSPEQLLESYPDKEYSGISFNIEKGKENGLFIQLKELGTVNNLSEEEIDMSGEYEELEKRLESIAGELIGIFRKGDAEKEDQEARLQQLNIDLQEALERRTELDELLTTSTIYLYFAEEHQSP